MWYSIRAVATFVHSLFFMLSYSKIVLCSWDGMGDGILVGTENGANCAVLSLTVQCFIYNCTIWPMNQPTCIQCSFSVIFTCTCQG